MAQARDAVTGAFSFTGRAIAAGLLGAGREVVSLVRRPPDHDPFDGRVTPLVVDLDAPDTLEAGLRGVDTLYNTHWIRFPRGELTFELAAARCLRLFAAAQVAGVRRIVHVSVVNAAPDALTDYFRAKASVEAALRATGIPHAIVRPTLTYGPGDILVNNLGWVLRRFPLFSVPGDGRYRLQPVHVDDVGAVAVEAGLREETLTVDAAGPEVLDFNEFVRTVRQAVGSHALIVHLPKGLALLASQAIGLLLRDVVLTRYEVTELSASLLVSGNPPTGRIGFRDWVMANGPHIGREYHSELRRHFRA